VIRHRVVRGPAARHAAGTRTRDRREPADRRSLGAVAALGAGLILVLGGGAAANAYWSAPPAVGEVGTGRPGAWVDVRTGSTSLAPGRSARLAGSIRNGSTQPVLVGGLGSFDLRLSDHAAGCDPASISVHGTAEPGVLAPGEEAPLPVTVTLDSRASPACQGVGFRIRVFLQTRSAG
jgi:hypothetical protein